MSANGPARVQRVTYAAPLPPPLAVTPSSNTPTPVYSVPSSYSAYSPVAVGRRFVDSQSFTNIGHSLWAIIVAFVGGVTAQLLAKDRKRVAAVKSEEESPA